MQSIKKINNYYKTIACAVVFLCIQAAHALPGFTPHIEDAPGEYVYYEDKTFTRKSYVGFLRYDKATYAARYYAPKTDKDAPLSVTIFVMLDPASDHMEITGEKQIVSGSPRDGEIVNYLEDMMYTLNAHRIKAGSIVRESGRIVPDDIMQFGGNVVVEYDYFVPLFNLKRIARGSDMTILFDVVSVGKLASSSDGAFSNFTGFPGSYADKKKRTQRKKTAAKKTTLSFDGQKLDTDEDWVQKMDNMWMLGNDAVISMASLPKPAGALQNAEALMIRRLLEGSGTSYADWRCASVKGAAGTYALGAVFYDAEKKRATRIVRKLTKKSDASYAFFTLSVFEDAYAADKSYFDRIVDSYTVSAF
ncbi:hypothetical protein [Treponema sp. SP13]|uniref:hypothetical protein n=1 Tax=Treponema sp. SP13 TaxID=2789742 RepID=UPI003D8E1B0C